LNGLPVSAGGELPATRILHRHVRNWHDADRFEVHSVPIELNAVAYAKAHRDKIQPVGCSYSIVLKDGKVIDLE
jgi:hypothetical protein